MSKKLLMNNYSENGLMPVMDGLVCWLDARDLKDTNDGTIWKDRSGNDNHATLKRLDFLTVPVIENGLYRTYKSGYVILPSFTLNSNRGMAIYINARMNEEPIHRFSRIFTIGSGRYSPTHFTIPNGTDVNAGKARFQHSFLTEKIIPSFHANTIINIHMTCDGNESIAINHFDNIRLTQDILLNYNGTFSNNFLNAESSGVININDMSYGLILIYDRKLSNDEMQQNYLYEQSIERG